mmetsp:Transcript_9514/g.38836  ORF Transcript_9514/g.38836 Transcript_9514/m.38836 type:complete len:139 (-) Transcript_9514:253-669(-)
MSPPHMDSFQDHMQVGSMLRHELNYTVDNMDRLPCHLCGDYQARERWILIGKRYNLSPIDVTSICNSFVKPALDILQPVEEIPSTCWIECDWTQTYHDVLHVTNPVHYHEFPRVGSTRASVYLMGTMNVLCQTFTSTS